MADDVAVFLDLDNIIISARELDLPFDIQLILKHIARLTKGRIVLRRAYGDWRQNHGVPETLAAAGFELQSVVRLNGWSKNLADMQMVVDALDTVIDGHKFTTYALLTGDRDFTPLVQTLRKRGKRVIGLGFKATASRSLVQLCDEYLYYERLFEGADGSAKKRTQKRKKSSVPAKSIAAGAMNGDALTNDATADSEPVLAVHYSRALRRKGLRIVPAGDRMLILKELVGAFDEDDIVLWGQLVRRIHARYREDEGRRQSKNAINSVLIVAKRARVIEVGHGETLSTAPVALQLNGNKSFQEAILQCDAQYLQSIAALDLPFNMEQAAMALYDSPNHARYLKIVYGRYGNGSNGHNGNGG